MRGSCTKFFTRLQVPVMNQLKHLKWPWEDNSCRFKEWASVYILPFMTLACPKTLYRERNTFKFSHFCEVRKYRLGKQESEEPESTGLSATELHSIEHPIWSSHFIYLFNVSFYTFSHIFLFCFPLKCAIKFTRASQLLVIESQSSRVETTFLCLHTTYSNQLEEVPI